MQEDFPPVLLMNMMIYGRLLHRLKVKRVFIYGIPLEDLQ